MSDKALIFPVAIDLGAKTTGVYAACYSPNTHVTQFNSDSVFKTGFVAEVDDGQTGYQLLQTQRTSTRHARRCRTRNRQAKRLLMLMLKFCLGFDTDKHQIAISHFINRRGYSYVETNIDEAAINEIARDNLGTFSHVLESNGYEAISALLNQTLPVDGLPLFDALQRIAEDKQQLITLQTELQAFTRQDKKQQRALLPLNKAVDFLIAEQSSGAKHRREYFENIRSDMKKLSNHPERHCCRLFHALHYHKRTTGSDTFESFYQLLCHINNFDLKLLNSILKRVDATQNGEQIEAIVAEKFGKWLTKQWRLSSANGADRLQQIRDVQHAWKDYSAQNPQSVIGFFLETPPECTVPPYESHTNRRPPSCQTLTLNPDLLSRDYPQWRDWLAWLSSTPTMANAIQAYRTQLVAVESAKGNTLIQTDELDARTLQFIFDSAQDKDPFKLNAIWGTWKKQRQQQRQGDEHDKTTDKLAKLLVQSDLPSSLTENFTSHPVPGDFWHLINRYFQYRRRAREGRYFLHYDNHYPKQHRWQRDGKLLVMCQHRPRQLKHQATRDIAVLLGVPQTQLQQAVDNGQCDDNKALFAKVKGLQAACRQAYQAQKAWGPDLKAMMVSDPELKKLAEKLAPLTAKVATQLALRDEQYDSFCERNQSVFTFAQLFQLVWGDRSGFAKTCPVCSADNANRMAGEDGRPQAARLNTLTMRLIDGGLKRLLTHQAHHIANRLWDHIEHIGLSADTITVPFIIEQNRFDFTENLPTLKGLNKPKPQPKKINPEQAKKDRIKHASQGLCPYSAGSSVGDNGDIDHIIPRSGPYGVLNDEANLIYSSVKGNRQVKKDRQLTLTDLNPDYLKAQFGTADPVAIKQQIETTLCGDDADRFSFGRYSQFAALSAEQQTAFRHALFLSAEHPLRMQVISAMLHRNKAKVNGTQRFMAQLLADILTKKAKQKGLAARLKFDYFQVSANGQDEDSTVALRRLMRDLHAGTKYDIQPFEKGKEKQHAYSHVIDATLAFMIAAEKHQGEGALNIHFDENVSIWGQVDENGVLRDILFPQIAVAPENLAPNVRVGPQSNEHRARQLLAGKKPHQVFSQPIFKQNALGLEFYDLAVIDGQLYKGFVEGEDKHFIKANEKVVDKQLNTFLYAVSHHYYRLIQSSDIQVYTADKQKLTALLFETFAAAKDTTTFDSNAEATKLARWVCGKSAGSLYFYSTSAGLEEAPSVVKKQPNSRFRKQWLAHYQSWQAKHPDTPEKNGMWIIPTELEADWRQHCDWYLGRPTDDQQPDHRAVKSDTMRAETKSSGAMALVRRQSQGKAIYQLLALDTQKVPKDHSAALALASPNLVLLDKAIFTKGYQTKVEEQQPLAGKTIESSAFFDQAISEQWQLDISTLQVAIVSNTSVQITGLHKDWVAEHLILSGEDSEKAWTKLTSIAISDEAQVTDVFAKASLKAWLTAPCRNDKSVRVKLDDDQVSLTLPYKQPQLRKLVD